MTTVIADWPAHTTEPVPVPLPDLGLCPRCPAEVRIRVNGRLHKHDQPHDANSPIVIGADGYRITACHGSGQTPTMRLEATFARWLCAQSRRRDDFTNLATLFAGNIFRPCTRSPRRDARDVDWSTAEQLHERLHQWRYADRACSSMCRDLEKVAALYEQLLAA